MNDYASHLIQANELLKAIYQDCIDKKYPQAMEKTLDAIASLRAAYSVMHDDVDRKSANPVGIWELNKL